ncbi:M-phase phosphoprotein 8 [Mactra antiquata]
MEPLEEETEENDFLSNRETGEVPELMENETSLIAVSEKKQDFVKISRKNKTSTRKPWSEEESAAVERQLGTFFYKNKLPGKHAIVEAQRKEPVINGRPWSQIKFYIKNKKVYMKKKMN